MYKHRRQEEKKLGIDLGTDGKGSIILDTEFMGLTPLKGEAYLMQYTGLKDKNGKEIYEGDIVKASSLNIAEIYVCRWDEDFLAFQFEGKYKNRLDDWIDCELGGGSYNRIEVIGNIYENRGLLDE